jgi:hypothetical protein
MKLVRFHPEAEEELEAAIAWYDARVENLGWDFEREIQKSIEKIKLAPSRWRQIIPGIHRHLVSRFPFAIVYQNKPKTIYIIAIMHLRRRPFYWRERI